MKSGSIFRLLKASVLQCLPIKQMNIIHGGKTLVKGYYYIFNMILESEYILVLYHHGMIILLYKGYKKNKLSKLRSVIVK